AMTRLVAIRMAVPPRDDVSTPFVLRSPPDRCVRFVLQHPRRAERVAGPLKEYLIGVEASASTGGPADSCLLTRRSTGEARQALLSLLFGCFFNARGDRPHMTRRVEDPGGSVPPELIRRGHQDSCSACQRALHGFVDIFDVDVERDRRTAIKSRRA